MNTCKYCSLIGEKSLFRTKNVCFNCRKLQRKLRDQKNLEKRRNNKEKENAENRKRYRENIDKERERKRTQYLNNKNKIDKKHKEYYNRTKNKKKEYVIKNREKINERMRKRIKERRKIDVLFRVRCLISKSLRNALNLYTKSGKIQSTNKYGINIKLIIEKLGCPPQDGKQYDIDHIFPITAFDLNDPEHIKLCWHPDNLQWLEHIENIKKSDKYDKQLFEQYLNENLQQKLLEVI